MFFDNYNNGQATPAQANTFGQSTAPQAPTFRPQPAPVEEPKVEIKAVNYDDCSFIEGWDEFQDEEGSRNVNIKVIGVGGGGNNAVNRMKLNGEKNATLVVVNTDLPVIRSSPADKKILIGRNTTRGRGAGANPEKGKSAAEESLDIIKNNLDRVQMVFITAGMGGGTGTGASPIIARAAKEMDILTVAVVTKPFEFEGPTRMAVAEDGINQLRQYADAVIVVPNQRLLTTNFSNKPIQLKEAFKAVDEILMRAVQSICSLINDESYINLDFADVTTILKNSGDAHIGVGIASGENKAMNAAEMAINSPLLETSIDNADGMIISVTADENVAINEISEAIDSIQKKAASNVRVIWGLKFDPNMGDSIEITVIATRSGNLRETDFIPNVIDEPIATQAPISQPLNTAYQQTQSAPQQTNAFRPVSTFNPVPQAEQIPVKPQQPKNIDYKFLNENEFKFIQSVANNSANYRDKK